MEPEYQIITEEIAAKGKGYLVVRRCDPVGIYDLVDRAAAALLGRGATAIYAASSDANAPLTAGVHGGCRLEFCHDMLVLGRALDAGRPRPTGRLKLEPLTREKGGQFLAILNASFFAVPNSATYGPKELEERLSGAYRCGFALFRGVPVGIYECGFQEVRPEIGAIGLTEDARGKGLGRELLLAVMDLLAGLGHTQCWLQVSTANEAAYPLYRAVGFARERLRSSWYEVCAEEDLRG